MSRRTGSGILVRSLFFWCFFWCAGAAWAGAVAERVAAVVGSSPILESEVRQGLLFARISTLDTLTPDSILRRQVLERLVNDQLLQEQAQRDSVAVERSEVAADVEEELTALRDRFDSEEEFRQALAAEGLTERSLRDRYSDEIRRKLLATRLLEKQGLTQIHVSPAEAERFYNEHRDSLGRVPGRVRLAHVLVGVVPSAEAEEAARARMNDVMSLLARGGEFPALARSFSEDAAAARGGDHGWAEEAELPPDLGMVIGQLKPGQISPPFRSQAGYVTVKLDERSGHRVRFRTLLIRVPLTRADTLRARAVAVTVRDKARAGLSFDSLARQYSADPTTADSGGFLGDYLLAGLSPPFDSVVAGLDSGAVSDPVLSEHGFHIIKVLAKQDERILDYLEVQDAIRNYIYQRRLAERLAEYLERVGRTVYVDIK
uniref:PpiC domain-containing protein n=1 Tax=candidate division WOR-3 bacterium TaxID=2052148 RepID=A0A7C4GG30_UNCW3